MVYNLSLTAPDGRGVAGCSVADRMLQSLIAVVRDRALLHLNAPPASTARQSVPTQSLALSVRRSTSPVPRVAAAAADNNMGNASHGGAVIELLDSDESTEVISLEDSDDSLAVMVSPVATATMRRGNPPAHEWAASRATHVCLTSSSDDDDEITPIGIS